MNIGWIFLICALIILVIMAFIPWWRKGRANTPEISVFGANQNFSAGIDELDARLVRRDEIAQLLQEGYKIKAIETYREDTGASLADAKASVERMELAMGLVMPGESQSSSLPGPVTDALEREIETLLMHGKKIQAIKLYREQTGLGLREAKDAVDLIENTLLVRGPGSYQAQPGDSGPDAESILPAAEGPDEEIRRYVLEGKKIQAIKLYREQTGLGLREAKEVIDRLEQTMGQGMEQI